MFFYIALLISGLFFGISGREVVAVGACAGTSVCEGTSVVSLISGCEYSAAAGGCVVPSRYNMQYSCDQNCKYQFQQWECPFNDPSCQIKTSDVFFDCCSGGGGTSYVAPKCTDAGFPGGVLTCESPATTSCVNYRAVCDWVFPSQVTSLCSTDASKYTCQSNCGCCTAGTAFVCSNTTYNYTYSVSGWELNNRGEMVPATDTKSCRNVNDVYVSSLPFNKTTDCTFDRRTGEIISCQHTSVCKSCSCTEPCTSSAPSKPTIASPANGKEVRVGVTTSLAWNAITNWGTACPAPNSNRYEICISGNQANCYSTENYKSVGLSTSYSWTPSIADRYVTWSVRSNNKSLSTESVIRDVCVEDGPTISAWSTWSASCGNATRTRTCTERCGTNDCAGVTTSQSRCTECGPTISAWSTCSDVTHQRTRTCTEDCGTDNCTGVSTVENCQGLVRGTLFDASNINSCPAFDPLTGYLTGLPVGTGISARDFGMTDASSVPTHPWSPLSPVRTDANGNFSISVYPKATYQLNFDSLSDTYAPTPKLICSGSGTQAIVPDNPSSCLTQPCSVVNNVSFGFTKVFGGWWQVVGGSVHGEKGIASDIPSSLPTEQSLILPDPTAGNRVGFLSYGITRPANMLGTNPNAQVSSRLWERESSYQGPIYDWGFYDTRFNLFPKTSWNGTSPIVYADGGRGYEILEANSSVNAFTYNPTGTQKLIVHVNGDVRITGNIVVPNGAFLMIIAKGTIVFDQAVTRADGWYVADSVSVPCTDVDGSAGCDGTDSQFVGNGTYVGWGGVNLSRNMGAANNTAPAEKFTYRQDFLTSAPEPVRIYTKYYQPFVP